MIELAILLSLTFQSAPKAEDACRLGRDAAVARAVELTNTGHGPESLACLQRALVADPDDLVLLTDTGIQADGLGQLAIASAALTHALGIDPGYPAALYGMARVEIDGSRLPQAEKLLRAYLRQRPQDASAHYGLGHVLQMLQRSQEAGVEFETSIRMQPVQTESYFQMGQMALDDRRDAEAQGFFNQTLARMPEHGGALTGSGILCYRQHRYLEASKLLERATLASPDYQPAHYYLGLSLSRLGEASAAAAELEKAKVLTDKQQGKAAPIGRADGSPVP